MRSKIVYFSHTEKTDMVSKVLAKALLSDLERLKEKKSRKGFFGFIKAGFDALMAKRSALVDPDYDLKGYALVLIGTPIWAGRPTPAILSYLDKAKLKGKKVVVFCTMAGNEINDTLNILASMAKKKGGELAYMFSVKTGKRDDQTIRKIASDFAKEVKSLINKKKTL